MAINSSEELITVKIGLPVNDRLPVEVWRLVSKNEEGGSSHQMVTNFEVPLEIPTR